MEMSKKTLNASNRSGSLPSGDGAHYSAELLEKARADTLGVGGKVSLEAGHLLMGLRFRPDRLGHVGVLLGLAVGCFPGDRHDSFVAGATVQQG